MGYDKKKLADLLQKVFANTQINPKELPSGRSIKVLGGSGSKIVIEGPRGRFEGTIPEGQGPSLVIVGEGCDAFEEFVNETLKDEDLRSLIGRDAVAKRLDAVLRMTGGVPPADLSHVVRFDILKPLREEVQPWLVFVPIDNLLVTSTLAFGDVSFVSREAALWELKERAKPASPDESSDEAVKGTPNRGGGILEEHLNRSSAFARVLIRAHEHRMPAAAADKALISVNILRSYTSLLYNDHSKAYFGLPTEVVHGLWSTVASSEAQRSIAKITDSLIGPKTPFELNEANVTHLKQRCHLEAIQKIMEKPAPERNSLENAILQAFQAIGRAIVAPTKDLFFLGCTIALERLLILDGEETTTERWSDRLAMALSDKPTDRLLIIREAKRLYDTRSRMVHAAYTGVADEDSQVMERWAITVLLDTLGQHSRFSSHEEFCKHVDPRHRGLATV